MSKKQFFTHIQGLTSTYHDVKLKHNGIVKPATIRKMAMEAGIVHDLSAKIEVIKGTLRSFDVVDLINQPRK